MLQFLDDTGKKLLREEVALERVRPSPPEELRRFASMRDIKVCSDHITPVIHVRRGVLGCALSARHTLGGLGAATRGRGCPLGCPLLSGPGLASLGAMVVLGDAHARLVQNFTAIGPSYTRRVV